MSDPIASTQSIAASGVEAEVASSVELVPGEILGRYRVRRLLGAGGESRVYLARDVALGRSVALKLVRGRNRERFLGEARAIARLNHPHIVQLYDFGEHRDGVFLALEYIDGITLRDRMRDADIGVDEALRHARAIADALVHAHASGVFHCDLKPSNVMIGGDGRVRVVDFGLARTTDTDAHTAGGTPDWMAPEQWARGALSARVDSWALGVIAAELLTGAHPLGADAEARQRAARDPDRRAAFSCEHRAVSPRLADAITRSLEYVPERRPDALEWQRALDDALGGGAGELGEDGPYPGLAAFDEQHARFFFGREPEVDEFLERLRHTPCLPIVGPSGAGKSSFLFGGVVPRLRARERWLVIAFRPGADPIGALAQQLVGLSTDSPRGPEIAAWAESMRADLVAAPTVLAAHVTSLARARDVRVLVAVDQLEEVFTQASAVDRDRFLAMLLAAADDPLEPVRVTFTVRDDFLGAVAGIRALFVVQRLERDALRRAVTGPLARYRYDFDDPTVVDDVLAEVGSTEVADLPLLQFACRTLWDGRDRERRLLRRATYVDMGGVAGALARHAERALGELVPEERKIARLVLLQLVTRTTRRTVARARLVESVGPGAGSVLDRLIAARLLVQRGAVDGEQAGASVEIAHESLIATWGQLARWLDESREERRVLDDLGDAAALWDRRGRRDEDTWPHDDLVAARHRAAQLELALPAAIDDFLVAGERRHGGQQRRRRRYLISAIASGGVVLAIAAILITRYLAREQLIRANLGTLDIALAPYNWDGANATPADASTLPLLRIRLYQASGSDANEPGAPFPDPLIDIGAPRRAATELQWHVQAPGGIVFLEIEGRGALGEVCAPSWVRIRDFPGYASVDAANIARIDIPTCQATRYGMVDIDAGPFIYGGPGEPASALYGSDADYTEPERELDLDDFAMDRTEVANGAYAPFARMEHLTGYVAPVYASDEMHLHDGDPDYPVAEVDSFSASAYCRYLGKRLPSDYQWVKAARGGETVHGVPNPHPRRIYPWGTSFRPLCTNYDGSADGYAWVAPVDAMTCGASPYGILNLAGNVQEWIDRAGQVDMDNPLHAMRGGAADSPLEREQTTTIFKNHRDGRRFDFSVGFRCVTSPKEDSI